MTPNISRQNYEMKTIALVGGLTWTSTSQYYKKLNEAALARFGPPHSAKILMYSFDFAAQLERNAQENEADVLYWTQKLEAAGADCVAICSNTYHLYAETVQSRLEVPLINLLDAVVKKCVSQKLKHVALLGTKYTMGGSFYINKLEAAGLEVSVPQHEDFDRVHHIIQTQLACDIYSEASQNVYCEIIQKLAVQGAEAVIMGCTEIPQLLKGASLPIPALDTVELHIDAICEFAL
jgi:aspartate racemase